MPKISVSEPLLAAIVVSYFPDEAVLMRLVASLADQVNHLILVDNGGGEACARAMQLHGLPLDYIQSKTNLGLGHALNVGFARATELGAQYVATFDQDSSVPDNLVADLLRTHLALAKQNINCAAVGPVFYDRREATKVYFPFYFERDGRICSAQKGSWPDELVKTDSLITSGMLIRAAVWSGGVRYDESLFVEYTDTEWCFRARAKGYALYGSFQVEMGHAPSDAPPARVLGLNFFRYSPLRRYYYFRNTVRFCRAPYVSFAWKRRLALGLALRFAVNLVIDQKKTRSLSMMIRGAWDGFRGKSGEFQK